MRGSAASVGVSWPQEERVVGSADQDLPYHHRTVNGFLYVSPSAATVAAFSLSRRRHMQ